MDCLSNEQVINRIVNFETETFMEDQKGVDAATNNLTKNFESLIRKFMQDREIIFDKNQETKKTVMVRSISSRLMSQWCI